MNLSLGLKSDGLCTLYHPTVLGKVFVDFMGRIMKDIHGRLWLHSYRCTTVSPADGDVPALSACKDQAFAQVYEQASAGKEL